MTVTTSIGALAGLLAVIAVVFLDSTPTRENYAFVDSDDTATLVDYEGLLAAAGAAAIGALIGLTIGALLTQRRN